MNKKQSISHRDSRVRNKDVDAIRELDDAELMKAISIYQDSTRDLCMAELQRRSINEQVALRESMFSVEKAIREQMKAMAESALKHINALNRFSRASSFFAKVMIGLMILSLFYMCRGIIYTFLLRWGWMG